MNDDDTNLYVICNKLRINQNLKEAKTTLREIAKYILRTEFRIGFLCWAFVIAVCAYG